MRKSTVGELADAFSNWARTYYHFDKVPAANHRERRRALRFWLCNVLRDYTLELEQAIMSQLSRKGGMRSAKGRRQRRLPKI